MITGLPKRFSNLILSISFLDMNHEYLSRDCIDINDYVDSILVNLFEIDGFHLYCRKIPYYFITKIVLLLDYFNNNFYKCNTIMEKLVFIIFYYIQDRKNILQLYQNTYGHICANIVINLKNNVESLKPTIGNMLKIIVKDIEEYIDQCRKDTFKIVNKEMIHFPSDIIQIIVDYLPDKQVLEISEMFL